MGEGRERGLIESLGPRRLSTFARGFSAPPPKKKIGTYESASVCRVFVLERLVGF